MSMRFAEIANGFARTSGQPSVFVLASLSMLVWLATGPLFGFSDAWQLVVNTITNVVTFLMVFLIQNTQNRDSAALQAKVDELIGASGARNTYIGLEHLTADEIDEIRAKCEARARSSAAGAE
jgi:low affinity Fe/Cu permease